MREFVNSQITHGACLSLCDDSPTLQLDSIGFGARDCASPLQQIHKRAHVRTTWKTWSEGNWREIGEFLIRCLAGGRHMSCIFLQLSSLSVCFILFYILLGIISMNSFCFSAHPASASITLESRDERKKGSVSRIYDHRNFVFRNHDGEKWKRT